jgi:signal transduction histidine kinase
LELITNVIQDYKSQITDNSNTIDIKLVYEHNTSNVDDDDNENNIIVYTDKNRPLQVISNLISNSIKFTSQEEQRGGIISINIKKGKI